MLLIFLVVLGLIGLIPVVTKKPFIWFPSLSSWLKALVLAIPTWFGLVVIPSIYGSLCFLMLVFSVATLDPLGVISIWASVGSLFLVGSLFWYLLLVGLYSLVLKLLWSQVPPFFSWLELPKKRDIFFGWIASTMAVGIGATPLLTSVLFSGGFTIENIRYRQLLIQLSDARVEALFDEMFVAWFVVCAYLYQIKSVYAHKVARNRKARQLRA